MINEGLQSLLSNPKLMMQIFAILSGDAEGEVRSGN
jgi:hypothetical protein